jgi:hypothetical protein
VQVDLVGQVPVDLRQRVVRQRSHVHDRVEAAQVARREVADVPLPRLGWGGGRTELAPCEPPCVDARHGVPGLGQQPGDDGAQVPLVAGQ